MADATGHGIDAAMITSMIKLSYSYSMKDNHINKSPSLVLKQIESDISQQMDNTFFTAIALVLDPQEKVLYYANAGHPDAILMKASNQVELLKSNLPMMGLQQFMQTMHYADIRINFSKGDKLLLFTDGLIDAKSPEKEEFSIERVVSVVKKHHDMPINMIGGHIIDACLDFKQHQAPSDDICILGIEVDD
jgi:sigma-B regulation protein RsbU (phosphoserine phosphatase)